VIINRYGSERVTESMTVTIPAYQAMYFENVAQAVDFCQALVPHLVSRTATAPLDEERAVVWFHVPPRSQQSTRDGCYLFASAGAVIAAEQAKLDAPLCGRISRAALPPDAVLLFGEDIPPTPNRRAVSRRPTNARLRVENGSAIPHSADLRT
jgi:hypothetical protein